jgi:hypothetical protein
MIASQRGLSCEVCCRPVSLRLCLGVPQLRARVQRLDRVGHKGFHAPGGDPDLSCRRCSAWSCRRHAAVAKHAVTHRVPGSVNTVVAHVGVSRGHDRGSNHLLVEQQELCLLQQVHDRDVILPLVADDRPGHVVDGNLY